MFTHKKMANFLHYVPYAIHGYGHCVSCLFSCLVPKPKYTTSLPAEASAQAGEHPVPLLNYMEISVS